MHKIYIKMPGKPVGFTDPDQAARSAVKEHEVEEIHPVMLFGEAPDGQTFVTHSSSKMSSWARHRAGVLIHEFHVYS